MSAKPKETAHLLFTEENSPYYSTCLKLNRVLFEEDTKFQHCQVIETEQFGKTLVLDGKTQSTQYDEYVYHECLVQPAMLLHPCPKTVFIGGGGELGTAREVLKHPSVEKVVMVDIDETVVEICKKELPEWHKGCLNDERLEVIYGDAYEEIHNEKHGNFDVIIMDIADPIECGPGIVLYTQEFYQYASTRLNKGGVLVTQSGAGSLYNYTECFTSIYNTLSHSFDFTKPYRVNIPSFAGEWAFNIAYNKSSEDESIGDYENRCPTKIDAELAKRLKPDSLKYYDGITHRGIFSIPKPIREGLAKEDRIMTKANPIFMY